MMEVFMSQDQGQKKKIKCAVYCRVSTDEQDHEGFSSLKAQEKSCKSFIEARSDIGWEYVETFSDVATGANVNRDGLKTLLY